MRASLYLIGFAAASLVTAGLFEAGCSSSSNNGSPPANTDAGDDGSATTDDGGSTAPCVPVDDAGLRIDTFDAGTQWGCLQAACNATAFTACSTDCQCNNAVLQSLACIAGDGGAQSCFEMYFGQVTESNSTITSTESCLTNNTKTCTGITLTTDGGDAGGSEDGGTTDGSTTTDSGSTTVDAGADAADGG
jgi:hypothetical protein